MQFTEKIAANIVDEIIAVGKTGGYDLIVVGRAQYTTTVMAVLAGHPSEHPELGAVGDLLASTGQGIVSSVLVVQHHDSTHKEEVPVPKIITGEDGDSKSDLKQTSAV